MAKKLTTYDPATALVDDDEIAFFMSDALATGDAGYIAKSLGVVARAKGMADIAAKTGLSREQLYRSFSKNGNPTHRRNPLLRALRCFAVHLCSIRPRAAGEDPGSFAGA